ncbi:MAG TPA: CinA family nicotinamide mononucleotide deamidase-related protein [Verrucomicrobia bacterium]|nr:CinA family nicotinamide mononucleotide deamidase-related protein [Verrucomicrobiales bacterium]HIL55073.1 CinA family nicotinamide mononucleotide deamidase-related protein [Verrucomicrobiota bacterium]
MNVEVINTGSELLIGQVVNTNIGLLGHELLSLGLTINRQITVPDGKGIKDAIGESIGRSDIILITGGLGPTEDDLTREMVSEYLGAKLSEDQSLVDAIRNRIESNGSTMRDINRKQAMVPSGAVVLKNENGTAPGLYIKPSDRTEGAHIYLLPGPPRELMPIFQDQVVPLIKNALIEREIVIPLCVNTFFSGLGESELASRINQLLSDERDTFDLGYCIKPGGVVVRCIGDPAIVSSVSEKIRNEFSENYISNDHSSLPAVVVEELMKRNKSVSIAESCTGGAIASLITDISGSSNVFSVGFITYANSAKNEILGVDNNDLNNFGAVSEPVVKAMAEGCLKRSGSNYAVAVSGIAGPTGGTEEKPVGTVFIGIANHGEPTLVHRYCFRAERLIFKEKVSMTAINLLRKRIIGAL